LLHQHRWLYNILNTIGGSSCLHPVPTLFLSLMRNFKTSINCLLVWMQTLSLGSLHPIKTQCH